MPAKVEVVHLSSPLCHWSWGFEPVIDRLEATYGKQVRVFVGQALPYVEREKWLEDYGMTDAEAVAWAREEILPLIRVPAHDPARWADMPASCLPAGIAVKAAGLVHGPRAERRLARALMNAFFAEGKDTSDDKVIAGIVEELGLDNARMVEVAATDEPGNALGDDGAHAGHGANFYSLVVRDGLATGGTSVVLEHAYDPARVERAIDHVAGRKLRKTPPKVADLGDHVRDVGLVSLQEVQTYLGVERARAKAALDKLTRAGELTAAKHPAAGGATFWRPAP